MARSSRPISRVGLPSVFQLRSVVVLIPKQKQTKVGVENLTKEDIDGLSSAQLKELRGY